MTPDGETQRYSGWEIVFNSGWEILLTRNLLTWVGGIFQGEDADHPWLVLLVEVVWGIFNLTLMVKMVVVFQLSNVSYPEFEPN